MSPASGAARHGAREGRLTDTAVKRTLPRPRSATALTGLVCALFGAVLLVLLTTGTPLRKRMVSHAPHVQVVGTVTMTGVTVRCDPGGDPLSAANPPRCSGVRVKVASSNTSQVEAGRVVDVATDRHYAVGQAFRGSLPGGNSNIVLDGATILAGCLLLGGGGLVGVQLHQVRRRARHRKRWSPARNGAGR